MGNVVPLFSPEIVWHQRVTGEFVATHDQKHLVIKPVKRNTGIKFELQVDNVIVGGATDLPHIKDLANAMMKAKMNPKETIRLISENHNLKK